MTLSLTAVLLLVLLLASTDAYKTFETVCSKPSDVVNYVSSADTRSTLDILWSCLLTTIACTWSVQHLNVPEQRDGRDPGLLGDIKWSVKRTWTSTKWMLATAIAPEMLLWKGWADRGLTRSNQPGLKRLADIDGVPWTLSHTHFSNMGGFVLRSYASDRLAREGPHVSNSKAAKSAYHNPFHLTTRELIQLRENGILEKLPYITEDELLDKSKGDSFVRLISILQISWMAVQIIARGVKHLAISQLEIGVLAFAACAILIYILSWKKPKSVRTPITILTFEGEIPHNVMSLIGVKARDDYEAVTLIRIGGNFQRGSHIPNHLIYDPRPDYGHELDFMAILFGTVLLGGIHVAAWDFEFPTYAEQIAWRCSSMICTFALSAGHFFVIIVDNVLRNGIDEWLHKSLVVVAIVLYLFARLFLLVELFRTLCFLPPSAYVATWAANIPHLS
jgi:hypothetical protein